MNNSCCNSNTSIGKLISCNLIAALLITALMPFSGCGETSPTTETEQISQFPEIDVWLTITDSIGVEMGDSNMVLGNPVVVLRIPENRIAVLDTQKCRAALFSEDGSFIASVGRQGSGPGEFLLPACFSTTPSGGFAVSDAMAGGVKFFDSELAYTGEMTGFFPSPPTNTIFLNDSTFAGMMPAFEMNEDETLAGFIIALWTTGSTEPKAVYFRDLAPLNLMDIGSSEAGIPIFTMSPEGIVYTTAQSTDEFVFHGWNTDGSELFTVSESYERVAKTPEEISREREYTENLLRSGGMPEAMIESMQPDEFKLAITTLGIAPDGNLWVGLGAYSHPVFRVYDSGSGEYLFTAALESPESHRNLTVTMNSLGFTALNPMSESWPRVYLLEIEN
jgi:hypothetical protein